MSHVLCTTLYETRVGVLRYAQRGMPRVRSSMGGTKVPKIFHSIQHYDWPGRHISRMTDREGHNHVVGW